MKIIFELIKNLPVIIIFIKELEKLINSISADIKRKEIYQKLTQATIKSRESGDTSELEKILRELK